jgi:threonine dehydratase
MSFSSDVLAASLADFTAAAQRLNGHIVDTPLLLFNEGAGRTIRLKAECLQPFGSFKIRAATNALSVFTDAQLKDGVATVSAGNFAQGLALAAQRRGAHLTAHVPETAATIKLQALEQLGVMIVRHDAADWWRIACTRQTYQNDGLFVHPVCEASVVLGNGTIGLELAQAWPELDTVVIPFGGGGLTTGIALALRAAARRVRIVACEAETWAPLAAARAAGHPVRVERRASFIDGIGSSSVLDEMWPLLSTLVDDVITVPVEAAHEALRSLALRNHLIVEGAAAVALAAALSPQCAGTNVAVILSGGNLDMAQFSAIVSGS